MMIPKIIWVVGFIITIVLTTTSVAYFFNIEPVNYVSYLMWFVALGIFYGLLDSKNKSVFSSNN